MKFIKSLLPYITIIIVVVLIRTFIITPVRVDGSSMYPTLNGGEIMILNKLGKINRLDIVVVKTESEDNIIKRVIGMPGETVELKDEKIYINDEEFEDTYGFGTTYNTNSMPKVLLKDDEYFVMGDNREVSLDSRVLGPINKKDIKGTTSLVIFPFKSFGIKK